MSRAYDNAADARFQQGGRRNLIINGAMQVAQRGTSFSSADPDDYSLDRWYVNTSGATSTTTQETLTVGQTDIPSPFTKYLRLAVTTGNNFCGIRQRIENVQSISNEDVVISFYAKGTNPGGGTVGLRVRQNFGSGGSTEVTVSIPTFTLTSSWQRFTQVVSLPSISGKTVGTSSYIEIFFHQLEGDTSTDAWTLDITGVQLEQGNVATPFEHRSYGEELALCQRYFCKIKHDGSYRNNICLICNHNDVTHYGIYHFPVTMRSAPTGTVLTGTYRAYPGGASTNFSESAVSMNIFSPESVRVGLASSGGAVGDASWLECYLSGAGLLFDAEL